MFVAFKRGDRIRQLDRNAGGLLIDPIDDEPRRRVAPVGVQ
jgi:hypothetical protein